jgi:pyruvate,water dikinase
MTEITDPIRGWTEPGRCWTLANVSEATPEVLSPLCWSVWSDAVELGARGAWRDFGILPAREVRSSDDPNRRITAAFFGRQAMNVDLTRRYMGSIPGTSAEEFELLILGQVREGVAPVKTAYRRLPFILTRAPRVLATQTNLVRRVHDTQLAWWQSDVHGRRDPGDGRARLQEACRRFQTSMRVHVRTRFLVQPLQAQVTRLVEAVGQPDLGLRLLSGFGGVEETAIARALWAVSRGERPLDDVLARYGFHGPAEGNPISRSWREDPDLVTGTVERLAARPDRDAPHAREAVAIRARQEAEAQLLARLPGRRRRPVRLLLRLAATHARNLELGKAAFLMAVDGSRAAARDLGRELVADGRLDEADDVFYLTVPELVDGPPADARAVVAFRRARREEYRRVELPVTFTGMPEPLGPAAAGSGTRGPADTEVRGAAGGPGRVEGTARVVLDPNDATGLEPGDILVCRFTDPSWAPLFLLADGLVIDLGGAASHGAIVARELGIPCVIGTADGTTRLQTGDRLLVDGDTGLVTILARAPAVG